MTIDIGNIRISLWVSIEAVVVFIVLWIARGATNRFIGHWLAASIQLTYSDRTLIQRVVAAVTGVVLIALRAAGVHMAASAVTGEPSALPRASDCRKLDSIWSYGPE